MVRYLYIAVVFAGVSVASLAIERVFHRSRREMQKPGWHIMFFVLFLPAVLLVYRVVPYESEFLYAAYGVAGGLAALAAQSFFGARVPSVDASSDHDHA